MIYSPKEFDIKYEALFKSSGKNSIKAWMAVPQNSTKQKIKSIAIFPSPKSEYKDSKGNKILYFNFKDKDEIKIEMKINATLWKESIDCKEKKFFTPHQSSKILKKYTKNEKFIEKTNKIKNITQSITSRNNDNYLNIKNIFDFIVNNFHYCYPVNKRGVKNLNFNKLKGDCGEYSSLFVAMCRVLNIPAKNLTGFVIFQKEKTITEHGWASIYSKPNGWIDFDTQYASLEKNRYKYFGNREEYRIVFTNGFNVPLKPTIPEGFDISYWNNLGLPMTKSSVQTLQPLVFASKSKIDFKDGVRLI